MRTLIILVLTGLFAIPVFAQDTSSNETIARCTDTEISQLVEIAADFRQRYDAIAVRLPDRLTDLRMPELDEVGGSIHAMQGWWHTGGEGNMPDCALGVRMSHVYSRLVDETLMTYLFIELELSLSTHDGLDLPMPLASDHAAAVDALRVEYEDINSELDGLYIFITQVLTYADCNCGP